MDIATLLDPSRYQPALAQLLRTVLNGPGDLPLEVRRNICASIDVPAVLQSFVHKVQTEPNIVADADVIVLLDAGYSEGQIREITVAAAVGGVLAKMQDDPANP